MALSNSIKNESERNNSIDIFRIICAYMVVMIHIHPFEEINEDVSYFFAKALKRQIIILYAKYNKNKKIYKAPY